MSYGKAYVFLVLSGFVFCTASGQSKVTDSLERKLSLAEHAARVDLLNQLTYEYITRDNDKVVRYNKEAIALSKKINYLKGEARAYTYRGVNEYLSGHLKSGHDNLNRGLALARVAGDEKLRGYTLLQLGNCSLEEVEMDSALIFFKQSYGVFKDSTDPGTLSKIYRNISALYGQRYQSDSQRIYLDRAIGIRRLLPNKTLLAESLILKANTTMRLGDFSEAEAVLREAERVMSNEPEDDENRNDVRHLKSLMLFQKGKFEEASILYDSARNFYFRKSLLRKYVTLLIDLSRIFSDRSEYELALNNLYDGLKLSQLQGFHVESAIIRNQIGWINYRLGDLDQALGMANDAIRQGPDKLLRGDQANALTLKGVVLTDMKDYTHAYLCLDSVFQIHKRLGDHQGMSEALRNLGNLEASRGAYTKALQFYNESVRLAEAVPYNYGLAWSFWGMGNIYFKLRDFTNSERYLTRSQHYAQLAGSNEIMINNYNTRRDLLAAEGHFKESLRFSILASQLKDSIHRTDVARRFANLEKIQEIEQRDRDIHDLQKEKLLAQDMIHLQEAKLKQQSILLIGGVVGLVMLGVLALVYYRFYSRIKVLNVLVTGKNKRIQAQANTLQEVNKELKSLYQEVSAQKEKIQLQANELSEHNRSITDVNRGLEKIVAEKTLELRTTNEELVKHNGELLQFSYTVSHNLRGPVARLLGLSALALSEQHLDQARQWITLIANTSADLDLIIKDLSMILDLRNEPNQYRERVDLAREWNQSKGLLQDSLTGMEEIITNFEALPRLTTVRPMLQSIFYNLLSNAIKYRSPDRNLRVIASSFTRDGKAILEIADNGLGFNTHLHREKLFKLYKRFHTHVQGRGLGLYLIKSQIEVLHGTIEVESEPGRGSVFRIVLPLMGEEGTFEFRQQA